MAQRRCAGGPSLSSSRWLAQQETVESICHGLLDDVMMVDDDRYRALCGEYLQEWPDLGGGVCCTGFGAPTPRPSEAAARETSNWNNHSFSWSGSGDGCSKRNSDVYACLDAKGDCKSPRVKQQCRELDEAAVAGEGKPGRPKAGTKKKAELALSKDPGSAAAAGQRTDYIHVRARRGQATDSHSLAERVRRERVSEKMRYLQELVPGCDKVTGKAGMLDEIINYVQSLQKQVEFLSMKIAASNPVVNFNIMEDLFGRQLNQQTPPPPPMIGQQLGEPCLQMSTMQQQVQAAAAAGSPARFGLDMVVSHQYLSGQPSPAARPVPAGASAESCLDVNGAAAWDIGSQSQNMFTGFDMQFQSVQSELTSSMTASLQFHDIPADHPVRKRHSKQPTS